MYYVMLQFVAYGPFPDRIAAYRFAADRQIGRFAVQSDRTMQQTHWHIAIVNPSRI